MTGRYETELAAIVNAPAWGIPNIDQLGKALDHLVDNLTILVASPGGKGNWAASASDSFAALQKKYFAARLALPAIDGAIANANNAKSAARDAYCRLPGISVPDEVKLAVAAAAVGTAIAVPILGPTPIAAALVLGMVEGMFGNQREAQAKAALDTLQKDLSIPAGGLAASNQAIAATPNKWFGSVAQNPTDGGSQSGSGSVTSRPSPAAKRYYAGAGSAGLGGSGAGQGFAPGAPGSSVGGGSAGSDGASHSSTSADGDLSGGTVPGTGNGGNGLAGAVGGLGGEGLRGLGIGAGSAASAAAVAAASRMGGLGNLGTGSLGGVGLGGGGVRTGGLGAAAGKGGSGGTGGLLGSGSKATVAATSAEEGAGGAAGSKSGNSMMGGQGGGAAGREKEKRSGLGGLMAPKLEDDEELGPRSAGARAGGRSGGRDAAGE